MKNIFSLNCLRAVFFFLVLVWLIVPTAAIARHPQHVPPRPGCSPHNIALIQMWADFQEKPVARGLSSRGNMVEVFATKDGSTWTIVLTDSRGLSCQVDAGEGWRNLEWTDTEAPGSGL